MRHGEPQLTGLLILEMEERSVGERWHRHANHGGQRFLDVERFPKEAGGVGENRHRLLGVLELRDVRGCSGQDLPTNVLIDDNATAIPKPPNLSVSQDNPVVAFVRSAGGDRLVQRLRNPGPVLRMDGSESLGQSLNCFLFVQSKQAIQAGVRDEELRPQVQALRADLCGN
jgi:hypothetical protein